MTSPAGSRATLARARWVFVRGLGRDAEHWGAFVRAWSDALPETEVLRPDLPGCGAHHQHRCPATVAGMVEAMRRTIDLSSAAGAGASAAGGDRPVALLGVSLGGMVAHEWLRLHPGEVSAAVLINTSLGGLSRPWRRLRPRMLWQLARAGLARSVAARERVIYSCVSARPGGAGAVLPLWTEIATQRPVRNGNTFRQLVAAARYRPPSVPEVPHALVLVSDGDRMVDPRCSRAVARALGADVRAHPDAGHDLPLDEPGWVAGEVARWIGL